MIPVTGWVAPFGDPGITDRSHLPRAFRSVPRPSSPLSAKASTRCPYLALDHRRFPSRRNHRLRRGNAAHHRRAQGQNSIPAKAGTHTQRPRMKTLLRIRAHSIATAPRVRLGHITTLSLSPFNQHPRRSQSCNAVRCFAKTPVAPPGETVFRLPAGGNRGCDRGAFQRSLAAPLGRRSGASPVVEVNGFEPMTSCLQSRRSPS